MTNANDDSSLCPHCNAQVEADDDFCPTCGALFANDVFCDKHPKQSAIGVCIVCTKPSCSRCGHRVEKHFLCNEHDALEIFEGMARVFGNSDAVQIEFAKSSLEIAGLHPLVFSRKASPISLGGPDYTLFKASGDYDGHVINEFKLMVPCQEVESAMEKLRKLKFTV